MNIEELVEMAAWIHDDEGYDLGASSTRDYRNAFWSRVIGVCYWGHPVYNPIPDPQWHLKDGGGGRPQSDDVAVSMPLREAYDCITGSGSDHYRFEAVAIGVLPADQHVYPPERPAQDTPAFDAPATYPGDVTFDVVGQTLWDDYAEAGRVPDAQVGRWFGRTLYDYLTGMTMADSIAKHRGEWRTALGLKESA